MMKEFVMKKTLSFLIRLNVDQSRKDELLLRNISKTVIPFTFLNKKGLVKGTLIAYEVFLCFIKSIISLKYFSSLVSK